MGTKTARLLKVSKIVLALLYTVGTFLVLLFTQLANNHWRLDLDGWFWFGLLAFYLFFFPTFASLLSLLQLAALRIQYGAAQGRFHRWLRISVYAVASLSAIASIISLAWLRSFDYYFYIYIITSASALLVTAFDSAFCRFRAKKLKQAEE